MKYGSSIGIDREPRPRVPIVARLVAVAGISVGAIELTLPPRVPTASTLNQARLSTFMAKASLGKWIDFPPKNNMTSVSVGCTLVHNKNTSKYEASKSSKYADEFVSDSHPTKYVVPSGSEFIFHVAEVIEPNNLINEDNIAVTAKGNTASIQISDVFAINGDSKSSKITFSDGEATGGHYGIIDYGVQYDAGKFTVAIACNYGATVDFMNGPIENPHIAPFSNSVT